LQPAEQTTVFAAGSTSFDPHWFSPPQAPRNAIIARQLADLTRHVEETATQLQAVRGRADGQQERVDSQQERIDPAARELVEVSARLQAAASTLRESI
jgi:nucleotide-binding universal stress UspA family protein